MEYLAWEANSRDTIDVKRAYVYMAGQDLVAGILLSQIIYWHLPNKEGRGRLRVQKDGELWLAKNREDWWAECCITERQYDRAVAVLEEKGLVFVTNSMFDGKRTPFIRINWPTFLKEMDSVTAVLHKVSDRSYGKCQTDVAQSVTPLTETTSEILAETTADLATSSLRSDVDEDDLPFSDPLEPAKKKRPKAGPMVQLHYEVTKRRLNGLQIQMIEEAVTDANLWGKVLEAWLLRGYNAGNIEGLLAWYKNGIPVMGKPEKARTASRETDYSRIPKRNLDAEPVGGPWDRGGDLL